MGMLEDLLDMIRWQNTQEGRDVEAKRIGQKYGPSGIIGNMIDRNQAAWSERNQPGTYEPANPLGDVMEATGKLGAGVSSPLYKRASDPITVDPVRKFVAQITGNDQEVTGDYAAAPDIPRDRERLDLPYKSSPMEDFERAVMEQNPVESAMAGYGGIKLGEMSPEKIALIRDQAAQMFPGAAQRNVGTISMPESNLYYEENGKRIPMQEYHDREMAQMKAEGPMRQAEWDLNPANQWGDPDRGALAMEAILKGRQAELLPTQIQREYEVGMEDAYQRARRNEIEEYKTSPEYLQQLGESRQAPWTAKADQQELFAGQVRDIIGRMAGGGGEDGEIPVLDQNLQMIQDQIINSIYTDPTLQTAKQLLQSLMGGGTMTMGGNTAEIGSVPRNRADEFLGF